MVTFDLKEMFLTLQVSSVMQFSVEMIILNFLARLYGMLLLVCFGWLTCKEGIV